MVVIGAILGALVTFLTGFFLAPDAFAGETAAFWLVMGVGGGAGLGLAVQLARRPRP